MANRTILVDNNTWNNTHISRVGQVLLNTLHYMLHLTLHAIPYTTCYTLHYILHLTLHSTPYTTLYTFHYTLHLTLHHILHYTLPYTLHHIPQSTLHSTPHFNMQAMSSTEDKAYKIMRELDVDYVLIIFGGLTGYSSDGLNLSSIECILC